MATRQARLPYGTAVINDPSLDPSLYRQRRKVWHSRDSRVTVPQSGGRSKPGATAAAAIPASILDSLEVSRAVAAWKFVELATGRRRQEDDVNFSTRDAEPPDMSEVQSSVQQTEATFITSQPCGVYRDSRNRRSAR